MVVVTDFGTLRLAFYELVTANAAPHCIIIFHLLASTKAYHRQIRPENRQDLCFPHDERVKKLAERIFSDVHNSPLVKVIKTRGENGRCCSHFVLLSVGGLFNLASGRLKNGLKVCRNKKNGALVQYLFWLNLISDCLEPGEGST